MKEIESFYYREIDAFTQEGTDSHDVKQMIDAIEKLIAKKVKEYAEVRNQLDEARKIKADNPEAFKSEQPTKGKPTLIEVFADNGAHSHWALVDDNGNKIWSEDHEECKAMGYPVEQPTKEGELLRIINEGINKVAEMPADRKSKYSNTYAFNVGVVMSILHKLKKALQAPQPPNKGDDGKI